MTTFIETQTYRVEVCIKCGVPFGITEQHRAELLKSHASFYCPNGHGQHFTGKTADQKAREAAEAQASMERRRREAAEADRDRMKFALRSQKAAKTRMARRVAAGVCPCCNRTFTNLAAHMAGQHPEFAEVK